VKLDDTKEVIRRRKSMKDRQRKEKRWSTKYNTV